MHGQDAAGSGRRGIIPRFPPVFQPTTFGDLSLREFSHVGESTSCDRALERCGIARHAGTYPAGAHSRGGYSERGRLSVALLSVCDDESGQSRVSRTAGHKRRCVGGWVCLRG